MKYYTIKTDIIRYYLSLKFTGQELVIKKN